MSWRQYGFYQVIPYQLRPIDESINRTACMASSVLGSWAEIPKEIVTKVANGGSSWYCAALER